MPKRFWELLLTSRDQINADVAEHGLRDEVAPGDTVGGGDIVAKIIPTSLPGR